MTTHRYHIGQKIRLVSTGSCGMYDGTTSAGGMIVGLTEDGGVNTYRVEFEDGVVEQNLYEDEFRKENES